MKKTETKNSIRPIRVTATGIYAGALFGATLALGVGHAHAENMCVDPKIENELNQCDGLAGAFKKGGRPSAPKSQLATATKRKKLGDGEGQTKPGFELDPEARRNRDKIQKKAWNLLQKEEKIAKRLADRTRTADPQRPKILLRLAETQFEMQVHLTEKVRSYDEPMFQARRAGNKSKLKQLRAAQVKAEQALKRKREEAIRTYATIVKDHEDFARMDEVLFSLAFGLEELRQYDDARQVYKRMIKNFPQSRFVPNAYLSFAEVYFAGDPENGVEANMKAAMQFYNKVLEFPPAKNPVYGYAKYKSAWAAYNLDRFKESLQAFVEVIEFAESNPHARDAENLARQSRRELVMPYAQVGTPNKALDFFRRYTKEESSAIDTFESLGDLYFDTGQWRNATTVFQRLISEKPNDDRVCSWQAKIALATVSEKNKEDRVREVKRLVDVLGKLSKKKNVAESALKECKQTAAGMTLELATAWHREAIGTDDQPGTNNRDTMKYAAELYGLALNTFPDMDKIEFPQFHKDDWPTRYRVTYYHAELLWKMEDWNRCGPAFDDVVQINPKGEYTNDAAYAAVLCYNNLYEAQYAATEQMTRRDEERRGKKGKKGKKEEEENKFAPKTLGKTESGMLAAFQRYVCVVKEADELVQIKYRRGRVYYENNHFAEASVLFRDIALKHPQHELAEYAANLYLDTLNVMGTMIEQPKVACVEELEGATAELGPKYCQPQAKKDEHEQLCGVLDALRCNVYRKKAETYHENKQFKESGREYDRILNDRTCHNVENPETGEPLVQIDEVLWNAALEYEAANLLGKAIKRRQVLIDKLPDSPLAKKAIYLVGANYHAIAAYEEAASYYEQFARKFPGEMGKDCSAEEKKNNLCPVAHEALKDAIFFRSALNQAKEAEADVRLFEKNYKRKFTQEASQVKYGLGSVYERAGDKKDIIRHYEDYLKNYRRKGLPHQVIEAHVKIGKIRWDANEITNAQKEFKAALREGKSIKRGSASSAEEKAKWEAQAKSAMSEALFYLAEDEYRAFKAIKFPTYKGGKSMARVNAWAQKDFKAWVDKKLKAVKEAQKAYEKIAELKIPPWEIAAAARIGEMWRSFVDEFRDAPIPKEIERDPELFDIYVGALDDASKPFVVQAKDKFEFCLITATKVRWFSDFSRQCEEELNRLDPREYPLSAEIRDGATHVLDTYGRPVPVELAAGDEPEEGSL